MVDTQYRLIQSCLIGIGYDSWELHSIWFFSSMEHIFSYLDSKISSLCQHVCPNSYAGIYKRVILNTSYIVVHFLYVSIGTIKGK